MARRTKEDALITRDQILDAAERVFQRRGVSRTSLQEIAQEAGLTRGAIYWHFQNKVDVFHGMMQRVTLPMTSSLTSESLVDCADALARLRKIVASAFHQTVHDPRVRRVFEIASHKVEYVDELQAGRDRHLTERAGFVANLERLLALAVAAGQLGHATPVAQAGVGLHALLDGLAHNWLLDPLAFDLEVVGMQALNTYLMGLGAAKPGFDPPKSALPSAQY
ncbi:TetR family transcriptional regulator [Candidatus Aalborgicola defluviihabitans]|jgi:TetR/AcrR family acrAB operon transcriptional repressor|uniref:TetR family transcriptional regulator n=1 Tax=Candidatus Aalborgicola defluviihabitans TaxID=3386187 RepID=UPI001DED8C8C|nr:TetR family transcriptional regulator [Burkholderiales bacterium]MBK6568822.1 TetR family transcriptional regulator [Burkholderiales bacterium]MBK7281106.1 TetR family transcriptional regulator [Burkholderiales bacterium]MBL0245462.1 TetR family transcriptional regulator [Rhodoferax sp.]